MLGPWELRLSLRRPVPGGCAPAASWASSISPSSDPLLTAGPRPALNFTPTQPCFSSLILDTHRVRDGNETNSRGTWSVAFHSSHNDLLTHCCPILQMRRLSEAYGGQVGSLRHTNGGLGPRAELRHSAFTPCLFPCLQVPPRKCPVALSVPSEALGWLCLWKNQRKTQAGLPHQAQVLFFCRESASWAMSPGPRSALPSDRPSPPTRDPASRPAADLPQQPPCKGVSWQHPRLALPLPGGCCHVPLVLSSSTSRHNYHRSRAASPQSQEITGSVTCPSQPASQRPGPGPRQPPLSCPVGLLRQISQLLLPAGGEAVPPPPNRASSAGSVLRPFTIAAQQSKALC